MVDHQKRRPNARAILVHSGAGRRCTPGGRKTEAPVNKDMSMRVHRSMIHVAVAAIAVLLTASLGYANILNTSASVWPDNSLIVDVQVTTDSSPAHVVVTYQASGVDPLVSPVTQVSTTGSTRITIRRLRANTTCTHAADAVDPDCTAPGTPPRGST